MADDMTVDLGNERQTIDSVAGVAEPVDEQRFDRDGAVSSGERGVVNGDDCLLVGRDFAS